MFSHYTKSEYMNEEKGHIPGQVGKVTDLVSLNLWKLEGGGFEPRKQK